MYQNVTPFNFYTPNHRYVTRNLLLNLLPLEFCDNKWLPNIK